MLDTSVWARAGHGVQTAVNYTEKISINLRNYSSNLSNAITIETGRYVYSLEMTVGTDSLTLTQPRPLTF